MIKQIKITNIKGIGSNTKNSEVNFDLHPNRPLIFVAPNGFGKSSIATAFNSLNPTKIILHKDHFYKSDEDNDPQIEVEFHTGGNQTNLIADKDSNQLRPYFDWFVINNQVFAKAKKNRIGGNVIASASLETPPIILRNSIPENIKYAYSISNQKVKFGNNGKLLENITGVYSNKKFAIEISNYFRILDKTNGQRIQEAIQNFIDRVNNQAGTAEELKEWIDDNELGNLSVINYLEDIAQLLRNFDLGYNNDADYYLSAIQIVNDYNRDRNIFKAAVKRKIYDLEKEKYNKTFEDFNSSWKDFKPKEKNGKLIVEIPKAIHISNGQRDVMCFISLLKKAELHLNKENSILIIDEVFDYLDDANLIAVQYYITQFIEKFKILGKNIYPIILTHLNPYFFKNFTFSKQKVFFLDKKDAQINQHLKKILENRKDPRIQAGVDKYHLHYEPAPINIRPAFEDLGIKPTWGNSEVLMNMYMKN